MAFTPLGQAPATPQPQSNPIKDFFTGVGQGGLSTLQNAGSLVNKGLNQTVGRAIDAVSGKSFTSTDYSIRPGMSSTEVNQKLQPTNTAQQVGKTAENIAEYFIPATKVSKAETAITALTQGLPNFVGAATRVGSKALVNAAADTAIGTAQTGDVKQGLEIGALGGATRGIFGAIGETARGFRLPERLYQTVFKNAKNDMKAEFTTDYLVDLYKTRPHVYNDLAEQGIIKMDNGAPVLNTTMAEDALGRGLKGSIPTMGKQVAGNLLDNEAQVRNVVKSYKGSVGLEQPQFFNILREISHEYKNVGFGEISGEADSLAKAWLDGKGKVSGETALAIRRLLDKARLGRSFDVPVTKLSLSQANLKTLADEARGRLNQIPGLKPIMDEYSFNLDALEDLAKEGARRGNNQLFSLIDSIFFGGGLASGNLPMAATFGATRRILQTAKGATTLGSALKNPDASAKTIGAIGGLSRSLSGEPQQQTEQNISPRRSFTKYIPK